MDFIPRCIRWIEDSGKALRGCGAFFVGFWRGVLICFGFLRFVGYICS